MAAQRLPDAGNGLMMTLQFDSFDVFLQREKIELAL